MRQVFNLQTYDSWGGALGLHVDGIKRPETAEPREGLEPVVLIDEHGRSWRQYASDDLTEELGAKPTAEQIDTRAHALHGARLDAAEAYLEQCREIGSRTRGPKTQKPIAGFLIAGLPRYGARNAWSQWISDAETMQLDQLRTEQARVTLEYTTAALRFILDRAGPGTMLVRCGIHQDEAAPHAHAFLVLADTDGRLGWNRIGQAFGVDKGALVPERRSEKALGRHELGRALQTQFHRDVASRFGLERGGEGGTSKRTEVDREKGLALRIEEERQEADREAEQRVQDERERARRHEQNLVAAHEAQLLYERAERRTITGQRDEGRQDLAAAQKSLEAAKTEAGEKLKTAQDRIARLEADMNAARGAEQHQKALVSAADKALAAEKTRSERLGSDVSAARQAVSAAERDADARDAEWKAALPKVRAEAVDARDAEWKAALPKVRAEAVDARDAEWKAALPKVRAEAVDARDAEWKVTLTENDRGWRADIAKLQNDNLGLLERNIALQDQVTGAEGSAGSRLLKLHNLQVDLKRSDEQVVSLRAERDQAQATVAALKQDVATERRGGEAAEHRAVTFEGERDQARTTLQEFKAWCTDLAAPYIDAVTAERDALLQTVAELQDRIKKLVGPKVSEPAPREVAPASSRDRPTSPPTAIPVRPDPVAAYLKSRLHNRVVPQR